MGSMGSLGIIILPIRYIKPINPNKILAVQLELLRIF